MTLKDWEISTESYLQNSPIPPLLPPEPLPLRVFVLGRFAVEQGSRWLESEQWRSSKARNLFKILLARRSYQISRHEALELLWPELDQDRASNNLNQAVFSLRRTLEPDLKSAGASAYLKTEGTKLMLNPALVSFVDAEDFKRLYRQAQLTGDLRLYEAASELYRGEYLPEDLYEDWAVARRESLRHDWGEMLMQMAALYQAQGRDEKYQQCLHRVLESDFSHEVALRMLMTALAENGRREEAIVFYRKFASRLKNRLDMEPLRETQQLYHDIQAGKVAPHAEMPAASYFPATDALEPAIAARGRQATPRPRPVVHLQLRNNIQELPEEVIELIGREDEQNLWLHRLNAARSGQGSLTLLTGEPGIGKTHLAKKLAKQAKEAGFVPLFTTCYPEQTELPFSPIVELLEQALASLEPEELPLCLEYCSPELYRMLPCLSHLASFTETAAEPNLQSVFVSVAQLLVWLQRQHPMVLVIDDLHYMPGPSARLLRYLLSHLNLRSLLVLGTLRPLSGELMPPEINRFLDWAGENPDNFKKLQRLEAGELHRLITLRSGHAPWNSVLELVGRVSRGNPRLALELVNEWRSEAVLGLDNGLWSVNTPWTNQIPQRVSAYIKRVVGSLHADAQVLLSLASLIGQSFSFDIVRRIITQRNDGAGWWIELDKTRLGQALEEITSCELVQENGVEYFFAYPLLAETLTANLPNGQRRCWQEVILWAQQQV